MDQYRWIKLKEGFPSDWEPALINIDNVQVVGYDGTIPKHHVVLGPEILPPIDEDKWRNEKWTT